MPSRYGFLVLVMLLAALSAIAAPARGQAAPPSAAQMLADRYAPIVVIRDQSEACDRGGEPYRPTPVETVLDKPEIVLLDDDGNVSETGPSAQDIAGKGPETSLDFPGNPRRAGCGFEKDFQRFGAGEPDVAYAHVGTDPTAPGKIALQYWFFWYFDDYVNTHEGDWEFMQIVFPGSTAEEALAATPLEVGYSQHSGGERADWGDSKLERDGDHPMVYAAAGSHANFFTSDLYLGRNADQGFGCDNTTGPSTRLRTEARLLPSQPTPTGEFAWLLFQGRWGEFQPSPYDAPPGPFTKEEWGGPIAWQDSLRDSSFAVPAGQSVGPTATGAFCSLVKLGGQIYTAVTSPVVLLLIVLGVVSVGGAAVRSTHWRPPLPVPLIRTRAAGQVLRTAWTLYRRHTRLLIALGAMFVPAAILESTFQDLILDLTGLDALVDTAGRSSLVSAATTLLVVGAGHAAAAALVLGGAAITLAALDRGHHLGVRDAYRLLGHRAGAILGTLGLSALVTVGLSLTIIGIPIAIRQLGRWSVAVQAAAIEHLRPRHALARSADLVHGRWWRTTVLAAAVNIIALASGPTVGIVLLFVSSLPLAAINAISSLVFVLTMPAAGAAMALLYGSLVSRERDGRS